MHINIRAWFFLVWALVFIPITSVLAETAEDSQPTSSFTQQELEDMLAPIALYPDPLLSQLLMAATYPLEVVEAARWSAAHPDLSGDAAVKAVADMSWDPSVKSLVAVPRLLKEMNDKLDWTEKLGDAFLGQREPVMDEVQYLRDKAYDAGNLKSSEQVTVERNDEHITVEPAQTEVVYVPYYNPNVVYGAWPNPEPPVYWDPWPGYVRPGYAADAFFWGVGVTLAAGYFFGDFDWGHHDVNVYHVNNYYGDHHDRFYHGDHDHDFDHGDRDRHVWEHDPSHRRGVPYRDAHQRQQYGRSSAFLENHRDYRGHDNSGNHDFHREQGSQDHGTQDHRNGSWQQENSSHEGHGRFDTGSSGTGHSDPGMHQHDSSTTSQFRNPSRDSVNNTNIHHVSTAQIQSRPHALEYMDHGNVTRQYSERGRSSFQQMTHSMGVSNAEGQKHAVNYNAVKHNESR